jgi:glycosyltransferase involved in cell wall biosynthesis
MSRIKVTIVSPTLSGNALFRTDVIRRLLMQDFDVQVIGFEEPDAGIYDPLAHEECYQRAERVYAKSIVSARRLGRRLDELIQGDVVICIKPLMSSFGLGLLARRRTRRPLLLDIDDWEVGFLSPVVRWEARTWKSRWFTTFSSPLFTRLLNDFIPSADAITVSNSFLQGTFGGYWVPHARPLDASWQSSTPASQTPKVLFLGVPRRHKGIRTLLDAWDRLQHPTAVLHLAVANPSEAALQELLTGSANRRIEVTGPHPATEIYEILRSATVVVVPQENAPGAVGQLPMKLLDAMAAGRAIVATDVGDASRWLLPDAGLVVPPGSPAALADGIDRLLGSPLDASHMGCRARDRFLEFGSESAVRPGIVALVGALAHRAPLPVPLPSFSAPTIASSSGGGEGRNPT